MAEEGVSVGWVLAGVVAVVGSLAAAVRWLAAQKEKQTDARVKAVEDMCRQAIEREMANAGKLDALNTYIRVEVSRMVTEAHDREREGVRRERELARILARCGRCPGGDPHDQAQVEMEVLVARPAPGGSG